MCDVRRLFLTVFFLIGFTFGVAGQNDEPTAHTGQFQVDSAGTVEIDDLEFEPDAIKFHITSTISQFDTDTEFYREEHGQGHGFAECSGTCENVGITDASGSDSWNGLAQASSQDYSIFQVITPDDGDGINGWIEGEVVETNSEGFKVDMNRVDQTQYVLFTAYNFEEDSDVDVGYFSSPTSTGSQKIETGNAPSFISAKMTTQITGIDETLQNSVDHGMMHGYAAENDQGIQQFSMGLAADTQSGDDHVYAASDSNLLRMIRQEEQNNPVSDRVTASVDSFNSDGFTLDYTDVDSGQLVVYMAIETETEAEVGYESTPTSVVEQDIQTDIKPAHLRFLSSNTITDINTEGFSGVNQEDNTYGWMYGGGDVDNQSSMMVSKNSNSINGHAVTSSTSQMYRLLYSDQDGNIRGREAASVTEINDEGFTLDWSTVESSSTYIPHDTVLVGYYGFEESNVFCDARGPQNECIMNQTNEITPGKYNVSSIFESRRNADIRSLEGTSTLNLTNTTTISGLWTGAFEILADEPRIEAGAEFRPENGRIQIGN